MLTKIAIQPTAEFVVWEIRDGYSYNKDSAEQRIGELVEDGWWPISMSMQNDSSGSLWIVTLLTKMPEGTDEIEDG